jgi:putative flippase GtrA
MGIRQSLENVYRRLQEAWRNRALVLKAVSFATIGVVNASIDFGVFTFSHYYLAWPIVVANPVAWMVAVTNSYVMNSLITFAAESGRRLRLKDYVMFAASQAGGLIANTLTVVVLSLFVPAWLAKIPALGASFLVDFSLSHLVVFRRREKPPHS